MDSRRLPSLVLAGEFGSIGTIMNCCPYWKPHLRYGVWSVASFPHMFYKLWLVGGGNKGYLEVIIQRRRTWITWWWPCGMESKDRVPLMSVCIYI